MPDIKSRKWLLTINNPLIVGLSHDVIQGILATLPVDYYCMSDEVATTGTPHTHIFIYASATVRFDTIKRKFPTAHIDRAYGNCSQNRDYVSKVGK